MAGSGFSGSTAKSAIGCMAPIECRIELDKFQDLTVAMAISDYQLGCDIAVIGHMRCRSVDTG